MEISLGNHSALDIGLVSHLALAKWPQKEDNLRESLKFSSAYVYSLSFTLLTNCILLELFDSGLLIHNARFLLDGLCTTYNNLIKVAAIWIHVRLMDF